MAAFKGEAFELLKSKLKAEFPLDTKNPENSNPLHVQLHQALDNGASNCTYLVSILVKPTNTKSIPPEKIKLYESLYNDFMAIVSAAMGMAMA